ncbi:MAG: hypothetical protein CL955_01110 [Erythrobacteraceae bacterium]|nr:hypothetical protein [Erythrobacteraceae bacterium]
MISYRASIKACTALIAAGAALGATAAQAAIDQYSVPASSRVTVNLEVCSAESQLAVLGDTGTDLDFVLTDAEGNSLHVDEGVDDYLSFVIEQEGEGCATYSLAITNLGEEANDFTVALEPIMADTTRVRKYIIGASETQTIPFKACGTSAMVSARGDGDTDLDFIIRNADGGIVHEDADTSDETTAELAGLLDDCEVFELEVANLGDVYNAMMLVIEPTGVTAEAFAGTQPTTSLVEEAVALGDTGRPTQTADGSGAGTYRAEATSALLVNVPVCGLTRLEVRGDGDTDLDFTLNDASGETVHSDFDLSDVTFVTLDAPEACETYELTVDNLGEVYNEFTVALIDPATLSGTSGPGEYRVNGDLATKVALRVCDVTRVGARGDGDTDLDFEVIDQDGDTIYEDYDLSDVTEFTLDPGNGCADYQLNVSNLGEVYNLLTVAFLGEGESFTASANGSKSSSSAMVPAIGFAKGLGEDGNPDRSIIILNQSGEQFSSIYWSNSATFGWGDDMLGEGSRLAAGADWEVDVADGSNACLFDFRAVTESQREIMVRAVNVCDIRSVTME